VRGEVPVKDVVIENWPLVTVGDQGVSHFYRFAVRVQHGGHVKDWIALTGKTTEIGDRGH